MDLGPSRAWGAGDLRGSDPGRVWIHLRDGVWHRQGAGILVVCGSGYPMWSWGPVGLEWAWGLRVSRQGMYMAWGWGMAWCHSRGRDPGRTQGCGLARGLAHGSSNSSGLWGGEFYEIMVWSLPWSKGLKCHFFGSLWGFTSTKPVSSVSVGSLVQELMRSVTLSQSPSWIWI
jgi:hypothetical protein